VTPLAPETLRGLPGPLPADEHALWQGSPSWTSLARRALHVRLVALYFVALAVWQATEAAPLGVSAVLAALAWTALLGGAVLGLALLYAWWSARATVYTITTRRVLLTVGIAVPVTLNLPFRSIGSAAVKVHSDGTGDLPLATTERRRLSYLVLWPHVRPWQLGRVQPMLRSVPDAGSVAALLADALVAAQGEHRPLAASEPVSQPVAAPQPVVETAGRLRPAAA
jgi:hypothetical protein